MTLFIQKYTCTHPSVGEIWPGSNPAETSWTSETESKDTPSTCPACGAKVLPLPRTYVTANCPTCKADLMSDDDLQWFKVETEEILDVLQPIDSSAVYCSKKCYLEGMFAEATDEERSTLLALVRSITNIQGSMNYLSQLLGKWLPDAKDTLGQLEQPLDEMLGHFQEPRRSDTPAWFTEDHTGFFLPDADRRQIRDSSDQLTINLFVEVKLELNKSHPSEHMSKIFARHLASAGLISLALKNARWE